MRSSSGIGGREPRRRPVRTSRPKRGGEPPICGLTGIVDYSSPPDPDMIAAMAESLRHRGPDELGVAVSGPAGLGHTRLSIIELSDLGSQPMWSGDGRYCLVYNGELYNAPELRGELQREGRRFRGRSDTEVVLEGLASWGIPALGRFNGMFGIALWDSHKRELTLARDRFGIKPLYYARHANGLVFGSEIKAVLESCRVDRAVDANGLQEFMYYGNALGRRTLFRYIRRVLGGEWLRVTDGTTTSGRFWSPADVTPVLASPQEATDVIREKLAAAVRRHLLSDVPVAALLSGGIDSSAVVAFAAPSCTTALQTFTVGFDVPGAINEFDKARIVATRFETDHHELLLEAGSVPDLLERLVRSHDQPFGDAANLPLLMIAEALSGKVKVVLQGDGGDEVFAGYRRYNLLAFHRALEVAAIGRGPLRLLPRTPTIERVDRLLCAFAEKDPAVRMARLLTEEKPSRDPMTVLAPDVRGQLAGLDPFQRYRTVAGEIACDDPVQSMLLTDASILLPDIFLEKVDRPMMAHGIEVRVPLLDADLTSYALGLPPRQKVRRLQKKWLLKKALTGVLPPEILHGKKTGFGVPYGEWLRGSLTPYARDHLLGGRGSLFDKRVMGQLLDDHVSGAANHGFLLYKCLNLAIWSEIYLGGKDWAIDPPLTQVPSAC
ncbi:MAG: asparagine synthase (glutamine-hydrolyzing) [Actinobacteria bacterium]|nr:asparagine synthase (glutamine-hydrolyzing) [Actinomycetota bacterium]